MAISGLNILYTTVHFPFPPIGGDRIKQLKILEYLAKNNNVFLISLDRGFEIRDEYVDEIRKLGIVPYTFKINNLKAYLNTALLSPFGLPMEINFFRHAGFRNKIHEILNNNKIDLIISYYLRTTQYTRNINCKKILISDDCRTFYQSRTAMESRNLRQRAIRAFETKRLIKYEADIADCYDITTYVTKEDLSQMRKLNGNARLRILSNGVDTAKYLPPLDNSGRKGLVFTGKLDVWVNNLIIKRIIENILPKIQSKMPGTILHIVGSRPTKVVLSYSSDSVIIHRDVPDITPYLQNAAAYIHAHLGGSGIQNKLLEAMSCGCPVVTTPSGAWGFDIVNGVNGFIGNSDEEIANYCVDLLNNPGLIDSVGRNAREYILNNHTWEHVYKSLELILEETTGINGNKNCNIPAEQ